MDLDEIIKKIDIDNNISVEEEIIIAVSNSYISKFYLDERLNALEKDIKDGIKILMVSFTEENGGVLELRYNDKLTSIYLFSYKDDEDFLYDEISAGLKLQKLEKEYEEMFNNLSLYCKMKFHEVDKFIDKHKHCDDANHIDHSECDGECHHNHCCSNDDKLH